jgi:hypothetical protein
MSAQAQRAVVHAGRGRIPAQSQVLERAKHAGQHCASANAETDTKTDAKTDTKTDTKTDAKTDADDGNDDNCGSSNNAKVGNYGTDACCIVDNHIQQPDCCYSGTNACCIVDTDIRQPDCRDNGADATAGRSDHCYD